MSGGILFITVIIIIAIYFYMRHTSRKRRRATDEIDTVRHYRENYLNYGSDRKRQAKQLDKNNVYRTYVTKYNSNEDFRERKGL